MRGRIRSVTVATLAAGLVTAAGVTGAQAASSALRCPSGDVCIARQESGPVLIYSSIGYHNISLVGKFIVVNNGSEPVPLCTRPNGVDCTVQLPAHSETEIDLTAFWSFVIEA